MAELQAQAQPRPHLPWEILALIFDASDASTLAALGQVSYDFLASTSTILYGGTVEIKSIKALELLFCERKTSATSRVNPLLSLAHIHTLSLVLPSTSLNPIPTKMPPIDLSSSRLPNSIPLRLPLFDLNIGHDLPFLSRLHIDLFPLLNPSRVNFTILHRPSRSSSWLPLRDAPPVGEWIRTRRIEVRGALPFVHHRGQSYLAGLCPPSVYSPKRLVRLHVEESLLFDGTPDVKSFLDTLRFSPLGPAALSHFEEGSVVLVMKTEEGRKQAEEAMAGFMEIWRQKFEVVLES